MTTFRRTVCDVQMQSVPHHKYAMSVGKLTTVLQRSGRQYTAVTATRD